MRHLLAAGLLVVIFVAMGCSSPDAASDAAGSPSSTWADTGSGATGSADGSATTTILVAVDELDLDEELEACVKDQLGDAADPAGAPADVVDDATAQCTRAAVFAEDFVAGLAGSGDYSDEELACLGEKYGSLSDEQVGAIVVAGLNPTDPPPEAREAVEALFAGCGLDVPD